MSGSDREHWESRLESRLAQHGVSDPGTIVARWKRHREKVIMRSLTELRRRLATTGPATASTTEVSPRSDPNTAQDERLRLELYTIHSRIADAEYRLHTETRKAADRLERRQGESEKALEVLKERLPTVGQNDGQQHAASGLGTVVLFGAALAAVVVTLVLALSLLFGLVGT